MTQLRQARREDHGLGLSHLQYGSLETLLSCFLIARQRHSPDALSERSARKCPPPRMTWNVTGCCRARGSAVVRVLHVQDRQGDKIHGHGLGREEQGQLDYFFSQLPSKRRLVEVASVGDLLESCPQLDSRVDQAARGPLVFSPPGFPREIPW